MLSRRYEYSSSLVKKIELTAASGRLTTMASKYLTVAASIAASTRKYKGYVLTQSGISWYASSDCCCNDCIGRKRCVKCQGRYVGNSFAAAKRAINTAIIFNGNRPGVIQ